MDWWLVVLISAGAGIFHALLGALNAVSAGEDFVRTKFLVTLALATMIGVIIGMQSGLQDGMGLFLLVFFSDYAVEKAAKIGIKAGEKKNPLPKR